MDKIYDTGYGFPENIEEDGIEKSKFYHGKVQEVNNQNPEPPDTERMKYTVINDKRIESDFMYAFLMTQNMEYRKHYLKTMLDVIRDSYGTNVIKDGLGDFEYKTFEKCINSDDRIAQDALWFIGLYTVPQVAKWLLGEGNNSPKIYDIEKTRTFVLNELPKLAENFFNGNKSLHNRPNKNYEPPSIPKPVDDFVFKTRHLYLLICGVPLINVPPSAPQDSP